MKKGILLLLCAALLGALLLGVLFVHGKTQEAPIENAGTAQNAVVKTKTLTYQGQEYPLKAHLQTVLLIGTDTLEKYEEQTEGVKRFYNHNQADFLMLLAIDQDANTAGRAGRLRRHRGQAAVPGLQLRRRRQKKLPKYRGRGVGAAL